MTGKNQEPSELPQKMPVPPSGSLGLLAYGYKGLLAWRLARENAAKNQLASGTKKGNKS